jgi:hypothetical protein
MFCALRTLPHCSLSSAQAGYIYWTSIAVAACHPGPNPCRCWGTCSTSPSALRGSSTENGVCNTVCPAHGYLGRMGNAADARSPVGSLGDIISLSVFGQVIVILNSHAAVKEAVLSARLSVLSSRPFIQFASMYVRSFSRDPSLLVSEVDDHLHLAGRAKERTWPCVRLTRCGATSGASSTVISVRPRYKHTSSYSKTRSPSR